MFSVHEGKLKQLSICTGPRSANIRLDWSAVMQWMLLWWNTFKYFMRISTDLLIMRFSYNCVKKCLLRIIKPWTKFQIFWFIVILVVEISLFWFIFWCYSKFIIGFTSAIMLVYFAIIWSMKMFNLFLTLKFILNYFDSYHIIVNIQYFKFCIC